MKIQGHRRYRLRDSTIVPGVTTVVALLAKPALVKWANKLGLDGIDSAKYADDKADIGTLTHSLITDALQGRETDTSDYSESQITSAKNCVRSYDCWAASHRIEPILIEEPLVSEKHRYGGTLDLFAKVDGIPELLQAAVSGQSLLCRLRRTGSFYESRDMRSSGYGYSTSHAVELRIFKKCFRPRQYSTSTGRYLIVY